MDELHKIARAYYITANEESKSQGRRFFKSIDHDGVGYMTKVPHWLEMGRIMGI
jgi:hypothetical protein